MTEWWTYRPSDFLLFAPRTYYRLFALYNEAVWPAHVVTVALGIACLALTYRGRSAGIVARSAAGNQHGAGSENRRAVFSDHLEQGRRGTAFACGLCVRMPARSGSRAASREVAERCMARTMLTGRHLASALMSFAPWARSPTRPPPSRQAVVSGH